MKKKQTINNITFHVLFVPIIIQKLITKQTEIIATQKK